MNQEDKETYLKPDHGLHKNIPQGAGSAAGACGSLIVNSETKHNNQRLKKHFSFITQQDYNQPTISLPC